MSDQDHRATEADAAGDADHVRLTVTMVGPQREQCGVADYTRYLLEELQRLVRVAYVADAEGFRPEMNDVDVVHVQHQYFLFGGVAPWRSRFGALANRLRRPAVMTVHEFVSPQGSPAFRTGVVLANRLHFRHPAIRRLIVHTEADRERLVGSGIAGSRVVVVRHGVPAPPPLPPSEEARRALGLEGRFVVTLFGFLSRRKGHMVAIEAARRLPPDVVLLFAGGRHPDDSTRYVADMDAAIRGYDLADRVQITGYLDAEGVGAAMAATDLLVAPFLESSGSGSLAMAFACGKPILASDIGPHREIVDDTPGSVALCAAGDAEPLADMVRQSMHDSEGLDRLARGARRYAEAHSYARMAAETVAVYRSVLAEAA